MDIPILRVKKNMGQGGISKHFIPTNMVITIIALSFTAANLLKMHKTYALGYRLRVKLLI